MPTTEMYFRAAQALALLAESTGKKRHSGDPGCGRQTRRPRRGLAQPPVGVPSGTPTAGIDFGSPAGRQGQRSHPTNAVLDRRSAARSSALGFARSLEQGRAAVTAFRSSRGTGPSLGRVPIQRHSATYRYIFALQFVLQEKWI